MADETRNFEILEGYAPDILAVAAHGRITREDYEAVLIPAFNEKVRAEGKVKLLFVFGDDFSGYSAGAAWDDTKFGFLHLREMAALAVVTDVEWIRLGVKTFAPFMPGPVMLFHFRELPEAKEWVSRWRHDETDGPGVAAAHRLPTPEDKA